MKTKRIFMIFCIALVSLAIIAPSSWAGSAQHHRLEGLALGIGAFIIGKAILDAHHRDHHVDTHVAAYQPAPPERPRPHRRWVSKRVYVPAKYKKVWNPGHYSRRGHWVSGHWTHIETEPGYWTRRRVRAYRH